MSNAKTHHEAIAAIGKYYSTPAIDIGSADVEVQPFPDTDSAGPTNKALVNMVTGFDAFQALRNAMFGKSAGTPDMFELMTLIGNEAPKVDDKSSIAIMPYYMDTGDPVLGGNIDFFPAGPTMTPAGGPSSIYSAEHYLALEPGPVDNRTPIYNISTMNGTFSREVGDSAAIQVFLNAIPTTEFSRCVPFIDVQFMGTAKGDDMIVGQESGVPSIYRFLLGENPDTDMGKWGKVSSGLELTDGTSDASEEGQKTHLRQSSGMEVFLSPQTMINADERSGTVKRTGGFAGSTKGVLDPFRPFMSLESLGIDIKPEVNSIIFSHGQLVITLHDRSRLGEISALVSPRSMGRTYIRLEYGWSHPDKLLTDNTSPIGVFLNTLRTQETFMISNSSYSFTPNGEVKITLQIASTGATAMVNNSRILDDICGSAASIFQRMEDGLANIRDSLPDPKGSRVSIQRPKKILESAGKSGFFAIELGKGKAATAMKALLDSINSNSTSLEEDLVTAANDLLSEENIAAFSQARTDIKDTLKKKMKQVKFAPDPWLSMAAIESPDPESSRAHLGHNSFKDAKNNEIYDKPGEKDWVSVGKLMNLFVAQPMVNSIDSNSEIKECQIYYGCLNGRASFASCMNIARIPIEVSTFEKGIERIVAATGPNIQVGQFIEFLNNYFFDNERNVIYGFNRRGPASTWKRKVDKKTGLYEYTASENQKYNAKVVAWQQKRLAEAYGGAGENLAFNQPLIKYYVECPTQDPIDYASSDSGAGPQAVVSNKILKIYIEDEKAMAFSGATDLMQRVFSDYLPSAIPETRGVGDDPTGATAAAWEKADIARMYEFADSLGLIQKGEGNQVSIVSGDAWKDLMKGGSTYIDIGSNHTAVMNASVSNQKDSQLMTVHMLDGASGEGDSPYAFQDFMPTVMMPQSINLTLMGCPLLGPLQTFFVDFRTGTDLDALYSITSVKHALSSGKFETQVTLTYSGGYSTFLPAARRLASLAQALKDAGVDVDQVSSEEMATIQQEAEEKGENVTWQDEYNALATADVHGEAGVDLSTIEEIAEEITGATANAVKAKKAAAWAYGNAQWTMDEVRKTVAKLRTQHGTFKLYNKRVYEYDQAVLASQSFTEKQNAQIWAIDAATSMGTMGLAQGTLAIEKIKVAADALLDSRSAEYNAQQRAGAKKYAAITLGISDALQKYVDNYSSDDPPEQKTLAETAIRQFGRNHTGRPPYSDPKKLY
ncbi:hypothetical protein OAA09_01320 [bacterium]|nr:hypothetical protein [bacterium]